MAGGQSEKPIVFEYLFKQRLDHATGDFVTSTITNSELQEAIATLRGDLGLTLSVSNPANFLKDWLRMDTRNEQWPDLLRQGRYTARQAFGKGAVFDFVPYAPGQAEPFPDNFTLPADANIHVVEAVSLSSAARALGRADESWLIQVSVHQRVLQTHFAIYSDLDVIDLFHLQNTLKGPTEVDAVFLLILRATAGLKKALVTFEAKMNDPILPDQIRNQVAYMAKRCASEPALSDVELIVPVAAASRAKQYGKGVIGVFEMEPIPVSEGAAAYDNKTQHHLTLTISKAIGYQFSPPVAGI
ncbi:hypothetical protein [Mesorhizobium sp.]|uniref:hypothetical protein n=1 Tax=Mesorhizobium sp. TaxID=1871066 RepID=UPI000FE8091D|nr:hypothetical protein [Mesorhizobium sp.]RWO57075.1 MAG: hypothetical protein EOS14_24705 [Mesorhizobium sp.]